MNGPNLNLLGTREPEIYGSVTLADIEVKLNALAKDLGVTVQFMQSNSEAELIERIHALPQSGEQFVIINPAAFTHTSVALRDAFASVGVPFIEVHLSNVFAREPFRHHSYLSDLAVGVISGLGASGYDYALRAACAQIQTSNH